MNVFSYLKILAFVILGVMIGYGPGLYHGKQLAKSQIEAQAAKEALERIQTLERNDAAFKNLSDRDKCLEFMRFSGLPDGACDG